jgi:hypothetical protein
MPRCTKTLNHVRGPLPRFLDRNFPLSLRTPNETPIVAVEQGGAAEAAIDGVNEMIDSMTNMTVVFVGDLFREGGMAVEQ